jgi:hypothetical protein
MPGSVAGKSRVSLAVPGSINVIISACLANKAGGNAARGIVPVILICAAVAVSVRALFSNSPQSAFSLPLPPRFYRKAVIASPKIGARPWKHYVRSGVLFLPRCRISGIRHVQASG